MFLNREKSDFAENHYYKLNQIFLAAISLWPYQQSKFIIISHIFHFIIMGSFVFFQLTSFLTFQFTLDLFVMVLSNAVPSCLYIVQYYSFCIQSNTIKRFWKDIRDSWNLLKNETERNIMRQQSFFGELCTILLSLSISISIILYAFIELLPTILDLICPLNETRPRELHALAEYFIDKQTYFYPILCHWLICLAFGGFVFMATGTFEMVYIDNVCGLFKIASYRIECSIKKYASYSSVQKKDYEAQRNIIAAVAIHTRALECSEFFSKSFTSYFFVLIVIGVSSTSLNLFRLLRAIISHNMFEFIASILFIAFHFIFLFLGNYYGQKITDCNNEVFNSVYNVQWYKTSVKIQKCLLFIMQNTTIPYVINIGNLVWASVEGFAKLVSTSMSYFTIIYTLL
ncbi:uncharacterized protein LOC113003324 isoform X2 [Solenopsis invicta]|uniref:uncharacterized protein LOC113003324 isoform X2 n=1 Tax=Solenopsis invicta TaxID=13686 RepID=UPI00193E3300|nr:uncharacterized protein LOC113003324 isoform X2 [Solenopsis invicta]